ncbi:MAG: hypothetical protein MUC96_00020 [Myxococcaceae bacterium]|jgi:hypothetical protein|nr:hypothetical protein [Myxococcaceae bacterium]
MVRARSAARCPVLAACLVAVTSAAPALGDDRLALTGPVRGVVVTNYGDLLNGAISIELEQRLFGWLGVELGVGMKGFRGPFDVREVWPTFAFAEAGVRLYPLGRGPSGVWFGPTARGLVLVTKDEGPPPRLFGWSLGGALGYHFVVAPRFVGQVALGASVADFGAGATFEPRVRLGLGFTF